MLEPGSRAGGAATRLAARARSPRRRARALPAPDARRASRRGPRRAGLMRLDPGRCTRSKRRTLRRWLAEHGQGPRRGRRALGPDRAADAQPARRAGLAGARRVRLSHRAVVGADAGDIGFHQATLEETIGEPAERALRDAGVEVQTGLARGAVRRGPRRLRGRRPRGRRARPRAPRRWCSRCRTARGDAARAAAGRVRARAARTGQLSDREPARGLRPAGHRLSFAAGVGTPVQYVFDRTRAAGAPAGCQYLAVSLSGAEHEMAMSVDGLRERYLPALRELFPRARDAARALPGDARARRHVSRRARGRQAASRSAHPVAGPRAGGLVDSHRLAGDARGGGAERPRRRRGRAAGARPGGAARQAHERERRRAAVRPSAGHAHGRCPAGGGAVSSLKRAATAQDRQPSCSSLRRCASRPR